MKTHRGDFVVGAMPTKSIVRLWSDENSNGELMWVDFAIVEVVSDATATTRGLYMSDPNPVENIDEADAVCSGFVKWDGCTQFKVDAHADHRNDLEHLFTAIGEARRFAAELMGGELLGEYSDRPPP